MSIVYFVDFALHSVKNVLKSRLRFRDKFRYKRPAFQLPWQLKSGLCGVMAFIWHFAEILQASKIMRTAYAEHRSIGF